MNIIQKIQKLVMSAESFDFASYVLADGTKIECDTEELGVGSIISIVNEDGSKNLAPAGEHTLEDGRTIVLDDAAKVTEIKESDAPTAAEVANEAMAMEVDPELAKAVADMLKAKVSTLAEEDATTLANEIVYAINAYDDAKDLAEGETPDQTENGVVTNTTTAGMSEEKFNALTDIVLEMAKKNEELEAKLAKLPSGKAISEMEFNSEPEVIDALALRIQAIKNLNK